MRMIEVAKQSVVPGQFPEFEFGLLAVEELHASELCSDVWISLDVDFLY